jgi:hypothetical protein
MAVLVQLHRSKVLTAVATMAQHHTMVAVAVVVVRSVSEHEVYDLTVVSEYKQPLKALQHIMQAAAAAAFETQ